MSDVIWQTNRFVSGFKIAARSTWAAEVVSQVLAEWHVEC